MKGNPSDEDRFNLDQNNIEKIAEDKQENREERIEISPQAMENQNADEIITKRNDRIEQLKKQIEEGTYKVQAMDVAEKMLKYFHKK
ncbi:flagellar biosynthesis anti-sigma factor FlgM [Bacillus sp. AFS017336]|uniref:flagellar biosynthesis anti-sigma factor FlgM n=1 Tax=Bacillus sp. AFS017336 TaxID=2033489 RepID=UPI000BF185B9|nr:flagellar biosynthesis anti-sigma factor FlgM [Bacillus sp. AFS017336]PEL06987.1 flagellar biosynthesis anti-sigma factor FlgM [Bacillus sp. AFS017336]